MLMNEMRLRQSVPVFINSYNQPTYVERLVTSFLANGFGNIIVIDQASTSDATKALLARLDGTPGCRVRRMRRNHGPRHFFDSMRFVLAGRYYIYTDPDIELASELPADFVGTLIHLSNKYRVGKVGCALDLSDSELFERAENGQTGCSANGKGPLENEARYWNSALEHDVYKADVDTTLALYNARHFKLWKFLDGVRVAGAFTVKHRTWYEDKRMPADELAYYKQQSRYSSQFDDEAAINRRFNSHPVRATINALLTARTNLQRARASMAADGRYASQAAGIDRMPMQADAIRVVNQAI